MHNWKLSNIFPLPYEKKSGGNTRHIEQFRVQGKT